MEVSSDVHSTCNKCGDVAHVVVALVSGQVAQVECKECGARHRYRSASGATPRSKARRVKKASTAKPREEPLVEPDLSRPIRDYAVTETYALGDRIDHSVFGTGVIELVKPSKVQVFFSEGQKTLVHSKGS